MVEPKSSNTKLKTVDTALPLARIRTIMKSTEDTGSITSEGLYVMTKATELFIQYLTSNALKNCASGNVLKYEHLSKLVNEDDRLEFLLQIIPKKIKVKEFREIILKGEKDSDESSSESEG